MQEELHESSLTKQDVISNPEKLNQYLEEIARIENRDTDTMYCYARTEFKGHIPRHQIEQIVEQKFRNTSKQIGPKHKKPVQTKKHYMNIISKLPKNMIKAFAEAGLQATNPAQQAISLFSRDDKNA